MNKNQLSFLYPVNFAPCFKVLFNLFLATALFLSGCSADQEQEQKQAEQEKKRNLSEPTLIDPHLKAIKDAKKVEAELLLRNKVMREKLENSTQTKQEGDANNR